VLAGAAGGALLGAVAVVGAILEAWWLVVAAVMAVLTAILVIALDAHRLARNNHHQVRRLSTRLKRQGAAPAAASAGPDREPARPDPAALGDAPPADLSDVVGALRVAQAQYAGRLDRLQRSVEVALDALPGAAATQDPEPGASPPDRE
jgi:hypothetical protein